MPSATTAPGVTSASASPCAAAWRSPNSPTSAGAATTPPPTLKKPEKAPPTTPTIGIQRGDTRACCTVAARPGSSRHRKYSASPIMKTAKMRRSTCASIAVAARADSQVASTADKPSTSAVRRAMSARLRYCQKPISTLGAIITSAVPCASCWSMP
ncbi:hypothetical protein D3C81_555480 [compost metagenome]